MASNVVSAMKTFLPIAIFLRLLPLCKAIWMIIDIILDVRQAVKYREYAYDTNGTYERWAENHTDPLTNHTETVSKVYFKISISTFFLPPLLLVLFLVVVGITKESDALDNFVTKTHLESGKKSVLLENFDSEITKSFLVIVYIPILVVIDYLVWCFFCYIIFPLSALVVGVYVVCGKEIDLDDRAYPFLKNIGIKNFSKKPDLMLLIFEHIGEALPQLILSVIFLVNNYPFLLAFDTLFGIPIPISLVSAIFSCGSLCMGIYSSCKAWCEDNDEDLNNDQCL